ncbi:MAG: hypothetical protein PHU46_10940 [Rhodocyclaceae bacterium]|nr:hypothetical protein [Rhodocyclaceae bacterium]
MQDLRLEKFGFRVRTRNGAVVERVLIHAEAEDEARVKLNKMYQQCEVLACWKETPGPAIAGSSFEELVDLLSR